MSMIKNMPTANWQPSKRVLDLQNGPHFATQQWPDAQAHLAAFQS